MIKITTTNNPNYLHLAAEQDIFNFFYQEFKAKDKNAYFSPLYRAKKWDGYIRFLDKQGYFLSGLLIEILRLSKINNFKIQFDKNLVLNPFKFEKSEIELSLKDVKLFDDQLEAVEKMLKYNYGLCKLPTSTGKSYIEIVIMNLFRLKGLKNMILIVPRASLVEQIYADMTTKSPFIAPSESGRLYGGFKEWDKPIVIATWQSLKILLELDKEYGKRFDVLIQDEVHVTSSMAKVTKEVITSFPCKYKYGFSATILSKESNKLEYLNSVSLFGPITATNTIKNLQDLGRISEAEIRVKLLNYPIQPEIKDYNEYEDFIRYDPKRRNYILDLVEEIRKENHSANGLILIRNVDFAQEMAEELRNRFNGDVHLIQGVTKVTDRINIKEEIKTSEGQILVATTGTFGMGENIPNLHYLILVQARKSEIEAIQTCGRLLRIFPGKDKALIFDITDNLCVVCEKEIKDKDGNVIETKKIRKYFGKRHLKNRIETFNLHGLKVVGIEKVLLK